MNLHLMEILVVILAAAGIYCAYRYYHDIYQPEKQIDQAISEQLELFDRMRPMAVSLPEAELQQPVSDAAQPDTHATELPEGETIRTEPETDANPLAPCEAVNGQTVGWIYIPDTNVDYPIMQGSDNDFYLHNGADGQYNYELGCPFLDYQCAEDFSGFNSIVYAHNMEGRAMFADIALYKEESFLQQHPTGYLTLEDGIHTVDFVAFLSVPSSAMLYQTHFSTQQDRTEYVRYLRQSARYMQNTDVDEASRLLLLSTCTFETEETRGVLVGLIR